MENDTKVVAESNTNPHEGEHRETDVKVVEPTWFDMKSMYFPIIPGIPTTERR